MNGHKWSGWPGAYCMVCGAEDPTEIALADLSTDSEMNFIFPSDEYKKAMFDYASTCPPTPAIMAAWLEQRDMGYKKEQV